MKLLLDANLSWRLVRKLADHFSEVFHVDHCDLPVPATDIAIWAWANERDAVIVTNDEDFLHLTLQKGFPPYVVLLRTGNQSTQYVANLLIQKRTDIEQLRKSQNHGLLEII